MNPNEYLLQKFEIKGDSMKKTYKKLKKIFLGLAIDLMLGILVTIVSSVPVNADEIPINIADMPRSKSVGCSITKEEVVDSYGNHYPSGVLEFACNNISSTTASFDLKGEYSEFAGTFTVSDKTSSEDALNIGVFVDGRLEFSAVGMTRRDEKCDFNIDVQGAGVLEIKASGNTNSGYMYLVDSHLVKLDEQSSYTDLIKVEDVYKIDSSQYETSSDLFCDSFGTLHSGYNSFTPSRLLGSVPSFVMYNLDKDYSLFEGAFVASPRTPSKAVFSVKILCDEKTVYEKSGITKTSEQNDFAIDVNDVKVIKIEIALEDTSSWYGDLYMVDNRLRRHQHTPGDWIIEKEATCTDEGKKVQTCTVCNEVLETEVIPRLGHTSTGIWETYREPTCHEEGEEIQYCSVCGNIAERRPIEKLAHTPSDSWSIVRQPSCSEEGIRQKLCSVCGEVVQEETIGKLMHDYGEWVIVSGNIWNNPIVCERKCSVCGAIDHMERNDTAWLKPLVATLIIVAIILVSVLLLFSIYGLPFKFGSIKKLISKMRNK